MNRRSAEFRALEKLWYEKLKDEGFEDIESTQGDARLLKRWHSAYFQTRYTPDTFERNVLYYQLAEAFFQVRFEGKTKKKRGQRPEAKIWEMHAKGYGMRAIAEETGINLRFVHEIIARLREEMKAWRDED